jgi:hypothetical protein
MNEQNGQIADHIHVVSNGKAELTLNELAETQPGMARLMVELSPRMSKCWWATRYENYELATFQLSEATKLLKTSVIVRPKYRDDMYSFIDSHISKLKNLLIEKDSEGFFKEFDSMVKSANQLHERFNKGFIVWKVSERPPEDLDLTPKH